MDRKQKGEATWQLILGLAVLATLLVLILFPLFAPGDNKGPAITTRCLSNVKQLAMAQIMYAADYGDRFPLRDSWMNSTRQYRRTEDVLRCSKLRKDKAPQNQYGYAMNQAMSGAREPPKPETVPLIFDSINLARNASGTLDSLPNPPRHANKNIISYADGHAKGIVLNQP